MDADREAYWRSRLGRIRIGAEPVEVQLRRRFLAMVVITGITAMIGLMLLSIFAAFGRTDVGLKVAGVMIVPATFWFWLDYLTLRGRVNAYRQERDATG